MNLGAKKAHVFMENASCQNANVQKVGRDQGAPFQYAEIARSTVNALLRRNANALKGTMVRTVLFAKDLNVNLVTLTVLMGLVRRRPGHVHVLVAGQELHVMSVGQQTVRSKAVCCIFWPSTADREDVNVVVNVFGTEFPKTHSSSYTCIFGASYSEGKRISSTVVRCRVPKQLTLGRHLFNLAPEGSISVIPNFDVRPIHFTVYDSCSPSFCKGVCVGPLCVCSKGATGVNCEIFEIIPPIDRQFLENQKASTAVEGSPYVVVLPTMPGSLYRVNSTIKDLHFDSTRGIIEWAEPIGSYDPYEITVISNSLLEKGSFSWNVTVEPSYSVDVTSVKNVPGSTTMRIMGKLRGLKAREPSGCDARGGARVTGTLPPTLFGSKQQRLIVHHSQAILEVARRLYQSVFYDVPEKIPKD
ncbi:hypothetical protein KIN20_006453 [Parelaphostrongylus tenuis]|uniref:Uncharacterized protein n=1 Tax=Parelaphostrongylus tenuis TaxID=148309 RepID=A0AAD5QFZ3_PARTN|nr:hypothetical protein KIN20_006453 [Parelaphostrongylus tenuis]